MRATPAPPTIQRRRDGLPRKRLMSTLKQLELKGSRIGSASGNTPISTAVRGSHLVPRLPKLQPPSPSAPPKHRSRAPLTVGLPPSSLASIALTKHQVDDAESSDLLVENMLRALIHMDSTPRSDVSSPLSPAVAAFDVPAGRAASISERASGALPVAEGERCAWQRATGWSSDGTQAQGSRATTPYSPTTVVRRRFAAMRCTSASPQRRPRLCRDRPTSEPRSCSPYLRRSAASGPARANHPRPWMQTLRFSPLRPRSPNGPATPTAEPADPGIPPRARRSWAHGGGADDVRSFHPGHGGAPDLVLRHGRAMAL